MKGLGISAAIVVVSALLAALGLSGGRVLFINGPRTAAITLGAIGFCLCTLSVGKFVSVAPAHPLSIVGYLVGTLALAALLAQIFKWNLPYLSEPKTALIVIAVCMVVKTVIARFGHLLK